MRKRDSWLDRQRMQCPSCGVIEPRLAYRHVFDFGPYARVGVGVIDTCNSHYCRAQARRLVEERQAASHA